MHTRQSFSGLTRVMWELAPVKYRQGGTMLATGSHKAAYPAPAAIKEPEWDVWDSYECPAGSVLFFSEALTHSTSPWTNEENDRVCVFTLFNNVGSKWEMGDLRATGRPGGNHAAHATDVIPQHPLWRQRARIQVLGREPPPP